MNKNRFQTPRLHKPTLAKLLFTGLLLSLLSPAFAQNVGIGTAVPNQKLDVEGWIELGDETQGGSGPATEGSIRYNNASNIVEYYDGTAWVAIGAAYTAGNDLDLTGTQFLVEDDLDLTDIRHNTPGSEITFHDDIGNSFGNWRINSQEDLVLQFNDDDDNHDLYIRNDGTNVFFINGLSNEFSFFDNELLNLSYLNFGNLGGATGYGFRENAGVMEYKDDGGSWTPFGAGADTDWVEGAGVVYNTTASIGIGTPSPSEELDVAGTLPKIAITDNNSSRNSDDQFGVIDFDGTDGTGAWMGLTADDGNMRFSNILSPGTENGFLFRTGTTDRMYIDQDGNVGVNTITPDAKLHVEAAGASGCFTEDFSGGLPAGWNIQNYSVGSSWSVTTAANVGATTDFEDTYLFTAALNLTGGNTYTISYDFSAGPNCGGACDEAEWRVELTSAQNNTSLVQNISGVITEVSNSGTNSHNFTPATTGTYYIAFHCTSGDAQSPNLSIDDIELSGCGSPAIRIVDGSEAAGYVLTSDASGFGTWQPAATGGADTDWTEGSGVVFNTSSNIGIGTSSPSNLVHITDAGGGGTTIFADDFEGGAGDIGGWTQVFPPLPRDWENNTGGTGSTNTGPTAASTGTGYIYCETSAPVNDGDVFELTRTVNLTSFSSVIFTFDYHMYFDGDPGAGTLELIVDDGTPTVEFLRTGDQGTNWNSATINLSAYAGSTVDLIFRFTVIDGPNSSVFQNDCALDNMELSGSTGGVTLLRVDGDAEATGNWLSTSDRRLKTNITPLQSSLEGVAALNGYTFYWKDRGNNQQQLGLVAQEVQEVFPQIVNEGNDGYLSVDYSKLVAPLIESIKVLKAQNEQLMEQNSQLKAEVGTNDATLQAQEQRIEELEAQLRALQNAVYELRGQARR